MSVYSKLARVQAKVSVPKAKKNDYGNFAFRSAEDILAGIKGACADVGGLVLLRDSIEVLEGVRYLVASAVFVDVDTSESVEVRAYAEIDKVKAKMSVEQVIGCASSYARKYALCGLFAIDNGCDIDSLENGGSAGANSAGANSGGAGGGSVANDKKVSLKQANDLKGRALSCGADVGKFLLIFGVKNFNDIKECDYQKALRLLEKKQEDSTSGGEKQ